jgi:zinc/manganese transport system substrate-binding protein
MLRADSYQRPFTQARPLSFLHRLFPFLLTFSLLLSAYSQPPPRPATNRLQILATFAPIHSWTLNVAGPDADVELLLPGDVGPHDFQLRPQDIQRIRRANLIIANGLGIDDWLQKAIQANSPDSGKSLILISAGMKDDLIYEVPTLTLDPDTAQSGHSHSHTHGADGEAPNPHVWLDPLLAAHGVTNILTSLQKADPTHAAAYAERAAAYVQRLLALHREFESTLDPLPNKAIVTYHDAFPYFCRRYNLTLAGVIEEVPHVNPSPRYLTRLSKVIRARNVRVIFAEPQFSPRLVLQLSRDLGVQFAELDVLETGKASASFYEDGMRKNLLRLRNTLR